MADITIYAISSKNQNQNQNQSFIMLQSGNLGISTLWYSFRNLVKITFN